MGPARATMNLWKGAILLVSRRSQSAGRVSRKVRAESGPLSHAGNQSERPRKINPGNSRAGARRGGSDSGPVATLNWHVSVLTAQTASAAACVSRARNGSISEEQMLRKLLIASAMVSVASLSGPSFAADKVTIPVIVKDTTSPYWQIVFAGARQAGKDLGVNVPELGAQSESDIKANLDPRKRRFREAGRRRHRPDRIQGAWHADRRSCQERADHRHRLLRRLEGLHLVPDHRQRVGRQDRC